MGISDWVAGKREKFSQERSIKAAGRESAKEAAIELNKQYEIDRQKQLFADAKQRELDKLTDRRTVGEKLQVGAQKLSGTLQKAGQFAEKQSSQLGKDIDKEFKSQPKIGSAGLSSRPNVQSPIAPKFQTPVSKLISQDNTKTPIGDKIFGTSFSTNKSKIGGFSKDNIKKFF